MWDIYLIITLILFILLFVSILTALIVQGQVIYDSITVESADTQNSTLPAEEDGDGANSQFSEATHEDNLVVGGLNNYLNEREDNDDEEND